MTPAAPGDASEHRAFFDCPVEFEAAFDGIEFDAETLASPLPGADPGLSRFWGERLRSLRAGASATALESRVEQVIRARLGKHTLAMSAVAHELGMGTRTLRRRLLERGSHYYEIRDRVRYERADDLLRDPERKLADVAPSPGLLGGELVPPGLRALDGPDARIAACGRGAAARLTGPLCASSGARRDRQPLRCRGPEI